MSTALVISGSPSKTSKTERVASHLVGRLAGEGHAAEHLRLRQLPPESLLAADTSDPLLANAVEQVEQADGLVLAPPTYKAAYSGLLKLFLDLLPQLGFAGKAVLPLGTGGALAQLLALDCGLRRVVRSLGARHVGQSVFLLDKHTTGTGDDFASHEDSPGRLEDVFQQFLKAR